MSPEERAARSRLEQAINDVINARWPEGTDDITTNWILSVRQVCARPELPDHSAFVALVPDGQSDDVSIGLLRIASIKAESQFMTDIPMPE